MVETHLSDDEKNTLLVTARDAITSAVRNQMLEKIDLSGKSKVLREPGASFVTLTVSEKLRGCIGTLEATQPLILDVQEHAVAAAMNDYRFPVVREGELQKIKIEISRLTPIQELDNSTPEELTAKLRIGKDGVLIRVEDRRATFLPQVWEKIPEPEKFLSQLCKKMGAMPDLWKESHARIYTYQVEKFKEK
jgi:AmmeMemoRadiSam system protein A